ncbi:MAG: ABC transporter permease [Gammaproteobacteria bacterium]
MRTLYSLVKKEWIMLLRDWHALLLLFAMPAVFILVMSLALQNSFASRQAVHISYYLINEDPGPDSAALTQRLLAVPGFSALPAHAPTAALATRVRRDQVQFLVIIPRGFGKALLHAHPLPLRMLAGPGVEPAVYKLFEAALHTALGQVYAEHALARLKNLMPAPVSTAVPGFDFDAADKLLHAGSLYQTHGQTKFPSSVQQNVPAWLVFAMFFIAIPLSTTWMQERQQGTYARLRSMGLNTRTLLLGKLLPYLGINLLQVIVMLLVGRIVLPWFGGDQLTLGHSPPALVVMALTLSFASVAYALLVANLVSTGEQATIFTGVANLLMAALGGIMVPRFLMPPLMQALSAYSPMAWGLDGFLDVFLRHGGLKAVAPDALRLLAFGLACLALAGLRPGRREGKG